MFPHISLNCSRQKITWRSRTAFVRPCLQAFAYGTRADLHRQPRQQRQRSPPPRSILDRVAPNLHRRSGLFAFPGLQPQTFRQKSLQIIQRLSRPRRHNQFGRKRNFFSPMPLPKPAQRIGAHQAKQITFRRQLLAQPLKRIQRVVGCSRGPGCIDQRNRKPCFALDRQSRHGHAVFKSRSRSCRLQWLRSYRRKQYLIQPERFLGQGARHRDVAQMRRGSKLPPKNAMRGPPLDVGLMRSSYPATPIYHRLDRN